MITPSRYFNFALTFFVLTSCGSQSAPHPPSTEADSDSGFDASSDADADSVTSDAATTTYRCCELGAGASCCEEAKQGTCFQYGGTYGHCMAEGEEFDAKVICAQCCDGLEPQDANRSGNNERPEFDSLPEGCDPVPVPSIKICLRCGDGVCGKGETHCNCPQDCP